MKKLTTMIIGSTITTLLLTASVTAFADTSDSRPDRKGPRHERGMQAMPVMDQLMRAVKHLDLDSDQKAAVKAVMQDLKRDTRPLMEQTKAAHQQLKELIKAEKYDEKAVAALAEIEGDLAAERLMLAARAMSNVFSQLTEEQRAELENMAMERRERREEKRGKHAPES